MKAPWSLILLVLAFVLFLIGAGFPYWFAATPERPYNLSLMSLGLAMFTLAELVK